MNANLFMSMFMGNEQTWARMNSTLASEDDIGVVLRIHLLTEKMLEAWCCGASNNPSFFDGFGESLSMSYMAKLKLASNFGLSSFSYNELKLINKIRNARSHQIDNAAITDAEINSLMNLIRDGGQSALVSSGDFGIWVDGRGLSVNDSSLTNREKFIAIFGAICFRISQQANDLVQHD
ncbi:hypothetical protein [Kluyvera ascorbata]|uniref:hypothetical protein n=1 Tax=Kluyvera ascorbata TaxID=51288 RepID=UPI0034D518B4